MQRLRSKINWSRGIVLSKFINTCEKLVENTDNESNENNKISKLYFVAFIENKNVHKIYW